MKPLVLRPDEPPDDAVVVVRGGAMESEGVRRSAKRNHQEFGFFGVSVFLAIDVTVSELCGAVAQINRYGKVRLSTAGRLRSEGFPLVPTFEHPHFDVVLPDVRFVRSSGWTVVSMYRSRTRDGRESQRHTVDDVERQLWVDFHRTDGAGLTHASVRDAAPGVELAVGKYVVVWDEGADDGVAEVVEIGDDGIVLVRVLPGPVEDHIDLVGFGART